MTLPSTYLITLLLTILTMLCWGSWANTQKLTRNWRFELFYFDYAFGVLLAAVLLGLTFGTLGYDGFSVMDDLRIAGKRQEAFAFAGGVVFNLANMLLVAAISVAGLAVAFPVGIGLALVIGVIWNYAIDPSGNPSLLFGGAAIVTVAIVLDALAYRSYQAQQVELAARAGTTATTVKKLNVKGILISLASGVLMGSFFPIVQMGAYRERSNEAGLGPYALGIIFSLGVFLSTFVFNLFFMNLPVEGKPVSAFDYFKGKVGQHALGILGGVIWGIGTVANFVAARADHQAHVGPAISYAMGQGATMISVLWGLLYWKEFAGAENRVRMLLGLMLVAFVTGLSLVSIAAAY